MKRIRKEIEHFNNGKQTLVTLYTSIGLFCGQSLFNEEKDPGSPSNIVGGSIAEDRAFIAYLNEKIRLKKAELQGLKRFIGSYYKDPAVQAKAKNLLQSINEEYEELLYERLSHLCSERDYNILLSHKPNYYRIYESSGADLVFSGHAHGGQFRLPSGIPLYTPDEGFFPRYAQGLHKIGNMILIVSRGLGQSIIPFRINNSPELVIVTLHSSTGEN